MTNWLARWTSNRHRLELFSVGRNKRSERSTSNDMDNNRDQWVDERLGTLRPDSQWQPDVSRGLARFKAQREKDGRRARRWGWLVAGAVAAGLPLMAFPTTRAFAQRCVSACVGQSNWVRDHFLTPVSTPTPEVAHVKPEDRRMAPDFVLADASGKPVRLSNFRGKVVLLNFWATWCPPCRAEIPWFIEFQKTYLNAGFETLGVSMDENGWAAVKPYTDGQKNQLPRDDRQRWSSATVWRGFATGYFHHRQVRPHCIDSRGSRHQSERIRNGHPSCAQRTTTVNQSPGDR